MSYPLSKRSTIRRARRRVLAASALAAITALSVAPAAWAADASRTAHAARSADAVQKRLDDLVRHDGFPAALAAVREPDGRTRDYTAGVADLDTKAKVPVDGRVRIGSNTKIFTAVVVLQLAGEGKVDLDAPVEKYLPGLIRGRAGDGRKITTRQLLQHTSGLPNYTRYMSPSIFDRQHVYQEPRELLDLALAHKASFPPGKGWEYSNTGYVVAGLIVQKVTGRPLPEEITNRIIKRVGLRDTYWPGVGDEAVQGPHAKGYEAEKPGGPLREVTNLDPSWGWAAGQLIATPRDMNRFLVALLDGRLLEPGQLAQMRDTVKTKDFPAGWEYGLGLVKIPLSCGGTAWGHGGDIDGYETRDAVTEDGRAATVAVTSLPTTEAAADHVVTALDTALCGPR
ncbi:serine hydrolase domain-containing protein [Sphaerisporangium fuscum]|uniref:serine hydrolase domain-containing protein n=1 Tax=Sphaerisporangium fuscum TaxID=2835868 RepID=UPI001BDD0EB9|nr:serine hydrolase domain-containing protein [Sphaerisporangium fuscum]